MNNSYSGTQIPTSLSGNYSPTQIPPYCWTPIREVDVYSSMEDESIGLLRDDMLRARSFKKVSTEDLERLYWHLRDYTYYCGIMSNYEEALETEKLLEYVFNELKDRSVSQKEQIDSEIMDPSFFQKQQMKYVFYYYFSIHFFLEFDFDFQKIKNE